MELSLNEMVADLLKVFSQAELSALSGVDQGTISKVKNGKINPRHEKGEQIRKFFIAYKAGTPTEQKSA